MNRAHYFVHKDGGTVAKVQSAPDGIVWTELADFVEVSAAEWTRARREIQRREDEELSGEKED